MKLKIVIVDDESNVTELLKTLIERNFDDVEVLATINSYDDAYTKIPILNPDAVLLDIRLDKGSGFDLLNNLPEVNFNVVFITAYDQYAIKAFKYNAVDYILKPIETQELKEAVNKLKEQKLTRELKRIDINTLQEFIDEEKVKLSFKTYEGNYLFSPYEIFYVKASGSYAEIHTRNKSIVVSVNLKKMEEKLKPHGFIKVHKSYIVNTKHIDKLKSKGHSLVVSMSNGEILPVSRSKKKKLLEALKIE